MWPAPGPGERRQSRIRKTRVTNGKPVIRMYCPMPWSVRVDGPGPAGADEDWRSENQAADGDPGGMLVQQDVEADRDQRHQPSRSLPGQHAPTCEQTMPAWNKTSVTEIAVFANDSTRGR